MSRKPLSEVLPPLILGTGTFNMQYNPDPSRMPYTDIVRRALEHNVTAFDTSPYYGPSELLLGDALRSVPDRTGCFLITKAGRIAADEFDYSPAWIRYSVCRSLDRLNTPYLDLVYAHDVEFVSPDEVLAAVAELRRLRDQGRVRYVGISGYPVRVLAELAELVLEKTGEPLDAVLSYSNFCVQNSQLGAPDVLARFRNAGVECVLNASMLSMGLITTRGAVEGLIAGWHPAPPGLREACTALAGIAQRAGEHLEEVAIRWAVANWARAGAAFGSTAQGSKIAVSVMGVSSVDELDETVAAWRDGQAESARSENLEHLVRREMWPALGGWKDYTWESGGQGFVNRRTAKGVVPTDETALRWGLVKSLDAKI